MKKIVIIVLLLNCFGVSFAQKSKQFRSDDYVMIPNSGGMFTLKTDSSKYLRYDDFKVFDIRKGTPAQLKRVKDKERIVKLQQDRFWGLTVLSYRYPFPRQSLGLRFEQNTGAKIYEGNRWKWGTQHKNTILISGKSDVEVIDGLVTPENAKDYRYRIVQNDSKELVGWTIPSVFKKTTNGSASYCYLGNLSYQKNQFIQIEIYNVHNYKDRDAILIDWREPKQIDFEVTIGYQNRKWGNTVFSYMLGGKTLRRMKSFVVSDTLNDVRIRLSDSLVWMRFFAHPQLIHYNYKVELKRNNDKEEKVDLGETNGSYHLYKEYWNKPGSYKITFTPKLSSVGGKTISYLNHKAFSYSFTIVPELDPIIRFSQREIVLIIVSVLLILSLIIYFLKRRAKKRVDRETQQRTVSQMQLSNIRSQLNPHFMFNALAGIQTLMNTHRIDEANRYLGKFARLTRNVLDSKELVNLVEEKALLEDYLQMEQLRFGFTYEIIIDKNLNLANVEIPTMLLQPFVENAVKHGVAEMGATGKIEVSFITENQNLLLKIKDNGKGFEIDQNYTGLGLQLSKNRISLLNTIYSETSFLLDMKSSENGSGITITLNQWL